MTGGNQEITIHVFYRNWTILFGVGENSPNSRLGSTFARMKLKGIDEGPHKRWSMWFNSMPKYQNDIAINL